MTSQACISARLQSLEKSEKELFEAAKTPEEKAAADLDKDGKIEETIRENDIDGDRLPDDTTDYPDLADIEDPNKGDGYNADWRERLENDASSFEGEVKSNINP